MENNQNGTNVPGRPVSRKSWKERLFSWMRLTSRPTVKVYRGFGHSGHMVVYGQAFHLSPLPRKKYRNNVWTNTLALFRLFIVRPYPEARVKLEWKGQVVEGISEKDGFFRLEWTPLVKPDPGWHDVEVELLHHRKRKGGPIKAKGQVYVPFITQYGLISDIDDTFLISHSSNLRKRLFVLFTQNARTREPFEGVVQHYQLLATAGTSPEMPNPFFYVSSSEWNLFDYIREFCRDNNMPKGVFLLSQLKRFHELFKTGQNKHKTKFFRIVRVLEAFPRQRFILLGDDTQEDPNIYLSIVEHFPKQIVCVYLRQVGAEPKPAVTEVVTRMESNQVPCCYFRHSHDAILHSVKVGLIAKEHIHKA